MLPLEISITNIKTKAVPDSLKQRVKERIVKCFEIVHHKGIKMPMPTVSFDLRGTTAGKAYGGKNHIQLNAILLIENEQQFISDTVGHEFAHLVVYFMYKNNVKPHGAQWSAIMRLLGQVPNRCHTYQTKNSSVHKTYLYACACQTHQLSSIRHNSGRTYSCKRCGQVLSWQHNHNPLDNTAPSDAMIKFAKSLSSQVGVKLPLNTLNSYTSTKAFIDHYKQNQLEPPTEKQINFANILSLKLKKPIPQQVLLSKWAISAWISANQHKVPS